MELVLDVNVFELLRFNCDTTYYIHQLTLFVGTHHSEFEDS
jgi:hypothetical protein